MKILGVILALVISANAFADTVDVSLVVASGKGALSKEQALRVFHESAKIFRIDTGINLRLARFRFRREPKGGIWTIDYANQAQRLTKWEKYFSRRHDTERLRLVILPPIEQYGKPWIAGMANGICTFKRINPVAEVNVNDEWILAYAISGFIHEAAHLMGATHDDSMPANAMHHASFAYVDKKPLRFVERAAREMNACL